MTFETLTPKGMKITIPDMHREPSAELIPFAVRCPNFIELNDGTILYFFCMKFGSQKDEEIGGSVIMRSQDGGKTWGEEHILTEAYCNDLGYPATVELPDGSLITVYYERYKDDLSNSPISDSYSEILFRTGWLSIRYGFGFFERYPYLAQHIRKEPLSFKNKTFILWQIITKVYSIFQ